MGRKAVFDSWGVNHGDSRSHRKSGFGLRASGYFAALIVGVIYFASAMTKGANLGGTTTAIEMALPFLAGVDFYLVVALVGVELVLASAMISGYRLGLACALSALLGLAFLAWHVLVLALPQAVDCGCGTPTFLKRLMGESASGFLLAGTVFGFSVLGFAVSRYNSSDRNRVDGLAA